MAASVVKVLGTLTEGDIAEDAHLATIRGGTTNSTNWCTWRSPIGPGSHCAAAPSRCCAA